MKISFLRPGLSGLGTYKAPYKLYTYTNTPAHAHTFRTLLHTQDLSSYKRLLTRHIRTHDTCIPKADIGSNCICSWSDLQSFYKKLLQRQKVGSTHYNKAPHINQSKCLDSLSHITHLGPTSSKNLSSSYLNKIFNIPLFRATIPQFNEGLH